MKDSKLKPITPKILQSLGVKSTNKIRNVQCKAK